MCNPIVPEVSIILENTNSTASNQTTQAKNYKEWKQQQQALQQHAINQYQMQTKNSRPNDNEPLEKKKIVKFNLPTPATVTPMDVKTVSTPSPVNSLGMVTCPQLDLSCIESARSSNSQNIQNYPQYQSIPMQQQPISYDPGSQWPKNESNPTSNLSNSDEMYRQMSLQQMNAQYKGQNVAQENKLFGQIPKQTNQEVTLDDIYRMLQTKLNQSPLKATAPQYQHNDEMNLWSCQQGNNNNIKQNRQPLATIPHQSSEMNMVRATNAEPSMKDLFNIILKQQEQLMNIQKQVHTLLLNSTNGSAPAIVPPPQQIESNQMFDRTEYKQFPNSQANPFGVMTSLEINVQQLKPCTKPAYESIPNEMNAAMNGNNAIKHCGCSCQCENKNTHQPLMIQSSDSESNDNNSDCFSKQDDKKSGWTFYGNILNQVNNVLQNASPENSSRGKMNNQPFNVTNDAAIQSNNNNNCNYNVRPNIRSTQIKQVGLQFDDVNISAMAKRYSRCTFSIFFSIESVLINSCVHFYFRITFDSPGHGVAQQTPTKQMLTNDKSMIMNALAMKYLPLENQSNDHQMWNSSPQNKLTRSTPPKSPSTDMSITSYRYLEKYGLL